MTWICLSRTAIFRITDPQGRPSYGRAISIFHRSRLTTGRFHGMMEKKQRG